MKLSSAAFPRTEEYLITYKGTFVYIREITTLGYFNRRPDDYYFCITSSIIHNQQEQLPEVGQKGVVTMYRLVLILKHGLYYTKKHHSPTDLLIVDQQ